MISTNLYIPDLLKVGFVKRTDTYLQTLAYVTYIDQKGVHRKQTSWENWRDKSIEPVDLANTPQSGFILNKDIQRYGWSHYSSGRSMIRMYDPRGVEFEITPANLLYILMNTNCYKRELEGEFVYAWDAKELVLLPVGSEEYKSSVSFTSLQSGKLTSKDMKEGYVYKNKRNENLIYLGKFSWLDHTYSKGLFTEKRYVFVSESILTKGIDKVYFDSKTNLNDLAVQVTDTPIENYAELLEKFSTTINAGYPVKFVQSNNENYGYKYFKLINDNCVEEYKCENNYSYSRHYNTQYYYLTHTKTYTIVDNKFKVKLVKNAFGVKNTNEELNQQYKRNIQVELNNGTRYDYR
jgi:hypothetical protein